MAGVLDQPEDEEAIYCDRGSEVPSLRPYLTGDVLEGLDLPGYGRSTAMVIAHPCTMRKGMELARNLICARVTEYQYVPANKWADGFMRVFPLSNLEDGDHRAVRLDEIASVESGLVTEAERVACLENHGIYLLQQRLIHSLCRLIVPLSDIRESMEHVLVEAELQQDWMESLSSSDIDATDKVEIEAFDQFLRDNDLRAKLADPNRRADAVKAVSKEISRRASRNCQPE